ncbi:hypothetical protein D9M72_514520 [compost metagenome]
MGALHGTVNVFCIAFGNPRIRCVVLGVVVGEVAAARGCYTLSPDPKVYRLNCVATAYVHGPLLPGQLLASKRIGIREEHLLPVRAGFVV